MIIRVSRGRFDPAQSDAIAALLREGEATLVPALRAMDGLLDYYVALDSAAGVMVNISVWDSLDHAEAMSSLPEMQAQRDIFLGKDVQFEPILNREMIWHLDMQKPSPASDAHHMP